MDKSEAGTGKSAYHYICIDGHKSLYVIKGIHCRQEVLYPGNRYLNVQEAGSCNIRYHFLESQKVSKSTVESRNVWILFS